MPRLRCLPLLLALIVTLVPRAAVSETAVSVALGRAHGCALTSGGAVQCWGVNDDGQLGDGTPTFRATPVDALGLGTGVTAITTGHDHTCALKSDGSVHCWGTNSSGQLGNVGGSYPVKPPRAVPGLTGAIAVAAGAAHTCAARVDGSVHCWGWNSLGQLGDGTTLTRMTPKPVLGLGTAVKALAAGSHHTCALTVTGAVKCWGWNDFGELGDGTTTGRTTAVDVVGLGSGVDALTASANHTCAVTTAGVVQCWGAPNVGQLGERPEIPHSLPAPVPGLPGDIVAVAAGDDRTCVPLPYKPPCVPRGHSCAVTTGGAVWCWGWNGTGQLGEGTHTYRGTPVQVPGHPSDATSVAAGDSSTCAVSAGGAVRCWGSNMHGQLGDGTWTVRSTPVAVPTLASGVAQVGASHKGPGHTNSHTCAVTTDGALRCWGDNIFGQLGDGTSSDRSTPVLVPGLGSVAALAAGGYHTCALLTSGTVRCWGHNSHGQLGDGTRAGKPTPATVLGLVGGVAAIAVGESHTCAVNTGNIVQCWGVNDERQLGDGTSHDRLTPVHVAGLDGGVVAVSAGASHTCAVTTGAAVKCWGDNAFGKLGDGTQIDRSIATPVLGLAGAVADVAAGGTHTCALSTHGAVQCWGGNSHGQLGDGTRVPHWAPVTVMGLANGAVALATGGRHTCAVTAEGAVWCWGSNDSGQLGDGTTTHRSAPVAVLGLTGAVAVTASDSHTCALTVAGAVQCWGEHGSGQMGDGSTRTEQSTAPVGVVGFGAGRRGFFAEGASGLFQTRFALVNPGEFGANAWLDFTRDDGTRLPQYVTVPPRTRRTVDVADVPGMSNAAFATAISSNELLVVDRTMSWGDAARGPYGSHSERSTPAPSPTWYLAEGSTAGAFNLFYLLQNPNAAPAEVRVRYLRPSGTPLEKTYTLPPTSRATIWVNQEEFPGVGRALTSTDVSAVIESTDGAPILVERAMYLDRPGQPFAAGHESAGVATPAVQWVLAEGATGPFFDLFVLIANPGDVASVVDATYLLPNGDRIVRTYTVAAQSRFGIWVDREDDALADTAVATVIRSTNAVPVVVERAMWWPGSFEHWHEGHGSPGAATTGTRWAIADGEVGGPRAVDTYLLLANASAESGPVNVTLLFEDGTSTERTFAVPAQSRFNVDVRAEFPEAADRRFGGIVESLGTAPAQIVVERATYWDDALGQRWAAGTNALATRLP